MIKRFFKYLNHISVGNQIINSKNKVFTGDDMKWQTVVGMIELALFMYLIMWLYNL